MTDSSARAATGADPIRVATFNTSLFRDNEGEIVSDLATPDNAQARTAAEIVQRVAPDLLLVNEFDHVRFDVAADLFRLHYLERGQDTLGLGDPAAPIEYPYVFTAPSNTGVASGFDFDNNGIAASETGDRGYGEDALGFGVFPGQYGMAVLSKYPILYDEVRTFQTFLWKDMPGARLPDDPATPEPADWYSPEELEVFRLSSKNFWDVPVLVGGEVVHMLAAHPTPPTFDGAEDRNGTRNADEIRLIADYVTPGAGDYIYDDAGRHGGLAEGERFVILGDMNADPFDGDSLDSAIRQLLDNPAVDDSLKPASAGGPEQSALQGRANAEHEGDPAFDTADFADGAPGNIRVDYALPSAEGLAPRAAGVFWPRSDDPLFPLAGTFDPALFNGFPGSDHRLVWVDLALAASSAGAAAPAAASDRASADMGAGSAPARGTPADPLLSAGDVDQDSAVLWARVAVPGEVAFEVSTDPGFAPAAIRHVLPVHDPLVPAKLLLGEDVIDAGTRYHWRATDSAGNTAAAQFATPGAAGDAPRGFRLGVSGDWRGELSPYPAISNADERGLDLFVKLGDTIYADYPSPLVPAEQATTLEEYRLKHLEVYSGRAGLDAWNNLQKTTAVLSTIDDHEVTNDFAGAAPVPAGDEALYGAAAPALVNDSPLFETGMRAFHEYNAIEERRYAEAGGARTAGEWDLYRYAVHGTDAATFVLDARSFRDPPLANPNPTDPAAVAAFLQASADPSRTMLGQPQLERLKADLLDAEAKGALWKFVMVPEPIQNLGPANAADRFEGYAAERTEILRFVDENDIENIAFVAADVHGTAVNNLTYQVDPAGPQIALPSFEVTTGAVAFDPPFGPAVIGLAAAAGLVSPEVAAQYAATPPAARELIFQQVVNGAIAPFGYDPLGLDNNLDQARGLLDATLAQGLYTATTTFGWTEFVVDGATGALTVRTWGVPPYDAAAATDPAAVAREPTVVSEFTVEASRPTEFF